MSKDYAYLTFGAFITAISVNLIASNNIVFGGISGLAIVLQNTFTIPISITNLLVNIILFALGWRYIGKKFLIRSLYTVVFQSIFLQLTQNVQNLNIDLIVSSIFGGILLGIGVGIVIKAEGSTGGTDMLALIINHIFNKPTSKCMFVIDASVISVGIFLLGINQALYAFIVIFFITKAVEETSKHALIPL